MVVQWSIGLVCIHGGTDEDPATCLRAEVEWSQAELAARVGVARGTINAIETGKYDPSLPLAFKIARVFGKNVEEVFLYAEDQDHASRT